MRLSPGQRKACEACGKMIVGAVTRDGKIAPIEEEPDERGNVLLFRKADPAQGFGEGPVVQCRTFGDGSMALVELVGQGVPMRLNHFAYCPQRERFKGGAR